MAMAVEEKRTESAAGALCRELFEEESLDQLMAATSESGIELAGEDGFLPELVKAVLKRGMRTELLGYEEARPCWSG